MTYRKLAHRAAGAAGAADGAAAAGGEQEVDRGTAHLAVHEGGGPGPRTRPEEEVRGRVAGLDGRASRLTVGANRAESAGSAPPVQSDVRHVRVRRRHREDDLVDERQVAGADMSTAVPTWCR